MSQYPVEPYNNLLPARLGRQLGKSLDRMETQAIVARRGDQLRIQRTAEAAGTGLVAVGQISVLEAVMVRAAPHAEGRLRTVADAGALSIAEIVYCAGR
jgi:hypothetical protein